VCGSSVGRCVLGTERCTAGAWSACIGSVDPRPEVCDGAVDDDCDGVVDNGCACVSGTTRACGSSVGACRPGTQTCSAAGAWGTCVGGVSPSTEVCDAVDNNCNGVIDEGCSCVTGDTRACGSSVGACHPGTQTCSAAGAWGACAGAVDPVPEVCNGADDNCNGVTDEGGVCPRLPPAVMCPSGLSTTVGTSVAVSAAATDPDTGSAVLSMWTVAVAPTGSTATPGTLGSPNTTFQPDQAGSYTLRYCATDTDDGLTSCCTADLTARSACTPPAAPPATTCAISWDRRPIVEFAPLPSGVTYTIMQTGSTTPLGTVTSVGQNYFHAPAGMLGAGGPAPLDAGTPVSASLYVRACSTTDSTCCQNGTPVAVRLIQDCTTAVPASSSNIVFSEYVIDGGGICAPAPGVDCQGGEAIEITNLSNCPVNLQGNHFFACNSTCNALSWRWMDFGPSDVIPPRGVYVAIRNRANPCGAGLGAQDPGLFGLRISDLVMMGPSLESGWFNNNGGGRMMIAPGAYSGAPPTSSIASVPSWSASMDPPTPACTGFGYNATDRCGDYFGGSNTAMYPNQLGRLWRPCDAVGSPVPAPCM
jgi:hypothetical protein